MFTTKSLFAACTATLFLSASATADDRETSSTENAEGGKVALEAGDDGGSPVSVGASVDVTSRALWRGIPTTVGGAVVPSFTLGAWGFSTTTTAYLGFDAESPQVLEELDVTLAWGRSVADWRFDVSANGYLFPGIDALNHHLEFVGSASWTGGVFTVGTLHGIEVISTPGAYYGEVNVAANIELVTSLAMSISSAFGWSNAAYAGDWYGVESAMPQSVGGNLSLNWSVGAGFTVSPHAGAWYPTDERTRDALQTAVLWNAGLAVAGAW
jgi:hypothetical protein